MQHLLPWLLVGAFVLAHSGLLCAPLLPSSPPFETADEHFFTRSSPKRIKANTVFFCLKLHRLQSFSVCQDTGLTPPQNRLIIFHLHLCQSVSLVNTVEDRCMRADCESLNQNKKTALRHKFPFMAWFSEMVRTLKAVFQSPPESQRKLDWLQI